MGEASSSVLALALAPTPLVIDGVVFPAFASAPAPAPACDSSKPPLFLAGAGVRGLDIGGKFIKFTAIGIYLEQSAIPALSSKWSASIDTPDQLAASLDFFSDIIHGPFEKFVRVTMILPLTGEQYSDKVSENCMARWKAIGILTEAEVDAVNTFKQLFKPQTFPPGSSILFTHSPSGALSVTFSEDGSVLDTNKAVIQNKALCNAVLDSIIGEHGVSRAAKRSLALRLFQHLKLNLQSSGSTDQEEEEEVKEEKQVVINASLVE